MSGRVRQAVGAYRRADRRQRGVVSLYVNLALNAAFAGVYAVSGWLLRSAWMGALALYYILLTLMRFLLLRSVRTGSEARKWRRYQVVGGIMLALTLALVGVYIITIRRHHIISYPGHIIYAVAAYTFYAVINAVRNIVLHRKLHDPVLLASKDLSLATAAVSLFLLQSALITTFGDDPAFHTLMSGITGLAITALIVGLGVHMLCHGARHRRALDSKA